MRTLLPLFALCLSAVTWPLSIWAKPVGSELAPFDPAVFKETGPKVDPDADAEYLEYQVDLSVSDGDSFAVDQTTRSRLRVFTGKGLLTSGIVHILFFEELGKNASRRPRDLMAIVYKPDGRRVELDTKDVKENTLEHYKDDIVKTWSFGVPGLEIGDVLECRWTMEAYELPDSPYSLNKSTGHALLQQEYPIRKLRANIHPSIEALIRIKNLPMCKSEGGAYTGTKITGESIPGSRDEPNLLPLLERVGNVLLVDNMFVSRRQSFWEVAEKKARGHRDYYLDSTGALRQTAKKLTEGMNTPEDKARAIYEFCRKELRNLFLDPDPTVKTPDWKTREPFYADLLQKRHGWGDDIEWIFAGMCQSVGLEARLALVGYRRYSIQKNTDTSPVRYRLLPAIRVGNDWRLFIPSEGYAAFGDVPWEYDFQDAVVFPSKGHVWFKIPPSPPESTQRQRQAQFILTEEGDLEGDVVETYVGQDTPRMRDTYATKTGEDARKAMEEAWRERLPSAEVTSLSYENGRVFWKPFILRYKLRIPGYATKTGARIIFQPNAFTNGSGNRFADEKRTHPILFRYAFTEDDQITLKLPQGWKVEAAAPIQPIGGEKDILDHRIAMAVYKKSGKLEYKRRFIMGRNGALAFPVSAYPSIRRIFAEINAADTHSLVLVQADQPPAANTPAQTAP